MYNFPLGSGGIGGKDLQPDKTQRQTKRDINIFTSQSSIVFAPAKIKINLNVFLGYCPSAKSY